MYICKVNLKHFIKHMKYMKYKDFSDYEVYPYEDKVINTKTGRVLKQTTNYNGYKSYRLYKDGVCYSIRINRLYWETLNGEIPDGFEIDHINNNRGDNSIDNLRLVTHKENMNNPITVNNRKEIFNTDEYKKKRSEIIKGKFVGEKNPMYGKPRPEGGGRPPKQIKVFKDEILINIFPSINEAARELDLSDGNIYLCLKGKRKHTKGYTFELV